MTSRDFMLAESDNWDRIVLYREGLFWKAYEHSAFAVCSQIRAFKPTKRCLKILNGGDLISIGFPVKTEQQVLLGVERISIEPNRIVLAALRPIVVSEFQHWKDQTDVQAKPLPRADKEVADSTSQQCDDSLTTRQQPDDIQTVAIEQMTASEIIINRLRSFNLADSTPLECMLLIADIKKILQHQE